MIREERRTMATESESKKKKGNRAEAAKLPVASAVCQLARRARLGHSPTLCFSRLIPFHLLCVRSVKAVRPGLRAVWYEMTRPTFFLCRVCGLSLL